MRSLSKAVTLTLNLALAACATNPVTGQREFSLMSEDKEIQLGQEQDVQVRKEMGVYADRAMQQYVNDVGLKLAQTSERPNLPWHFAVVDSPAINAFALPGGYIYITRGILPFLQDESQMAGVLGHEIGHVNARHSARQYSRSTASQLGLIVGSIFVPQTRPFAQLGESGLGLLMLKNSRDDELEADSLGAKYAARAGWDPDGIPQMLTTLERIAEASDNRGVPNWMQTHPVAEDRVQKVQAAVRDAEQGATKFTVDRDGYLKRMDGLVYGDNPNEGIVRGETFMHANLRLAIDFPQGWDVTNGQSQVSAKEPGQNRLMVLEVVQRPVGRSLQEVALRQMEGAGFRPVQGGRTTINSLDAFVGEYVGALQNIGRVGIRAAHIAHDRSVFLVAGIVPYQDYPNVEPVLTKSIDSFRALTRAEAEDVHANHVALYTAHRGDTWQGIAERAGKGIVKPSTLAIMNGHPVNEQPRVGERLKIVIPG
ncbi:MAG TPA: M48 family metalloprotease [Vicinamibacterales bacterium]|nr:M48 family metalloprotease [Vicinamibacterales bacterium]